MIIKFCSGLIKDLVYFDSIRSFHDILSSLNGFLVSSLFILKSKLRTFFFGINDRLASLFSCFNIVDVFSCNFSYFWCFSFKKLFIFSDLLYFPWKFAFFFENLILMKTESIERMSLSKTYKFVIRFENFKDWALSLLAYCLVCKRIWRWWMG